MSLLSKQTSYQTDMQTSLSETATTDRLFGWWYAVATPATRLDNAPLQTRDAIRKARLTSIILLIEMILSIGDIVTSLAYSYSIQLFIAATISIFSMLAGVELNRRGKTLAAIIIVLAILEIDMCYFLITGAFTPGSHPPINLIAYMILLQPSIMVAALLPAPMALSVSLFNSLFSTIMPIIAQTNMKLINLPPELFFNAAFITISTQVVVMIVNVFWTSNVQQEMQRADQTEEINRLTEALAEQQRQALEEKQRLEESIKQIVKVHTQIANGDLNARVHIDQGNKLWLIASSLNNILARLQRWQQDAKKQQQTEQAIQYLITALHTAKMQGTQIKIQKTGTPIDPLIAEIINDPSFARSNRAHPEAPFPAISSSWPAGTPIPPDIASWSAQAPLRANKETPPFNPLFNLPTSERKSGA